MYHCKGYRKLGRISPHRKALLRNIILSLFKYGRVITTLSISKEAKRMAERIITLGKKGNYARVSSILRDKEVFKKIPQYVAKYQSRNGGYTRLIKIGTRKGDGAFRAMMEMVD